MPVKTVKTSVAAPTHGVVRVMLRKRLQGMSARLREQIAREAGELAIARDARGEDETPSQHPADIAGDLEIRESLLSDELQQLRLLADVEAALNRMNRGTYGRCVDCGRAIPEDRLEALPQASRDTACARMAAGRH